MKESRYIVLSEHDVFLTELGSLYCLDEVSWSRWKAHSLTHIFFSRDESIDYYVVDIPTFHDSNLVRVGLRQLLDKAPAQEFQRAGKAVQYLRWYQDHQFCGRCGSATEMMTNETAMVCVACKMTFYPRLSPCVIGLVTRGDYCLLAWHQRSEKPKYSCLAGFIEPGETPEEAFVREVYEEVGLSVRAPVYRKSQAWPFPGQLMLGFEAEYMSGDIVPEEGEIRDARWFRFDELPSIPGRNTISGQLIYQFVESRSMAS